MSLLEKHAAMIGEMIHLQNQLNLVVNPLWRQTGNTWYRAIWVECGEMMDHFGWKWWKKQDEDMAQVQLELIDIWHFGLSDLIDKSGQTVEAYIAEQSEDLAGRFHNAMTANLSDEKEEKRKAIEAFAASTISMKGFPVYKFFELMKHFDLSIESLYEQYLAKNILNIFRQEHGYKTGEYKKMWGEVEDNVALVSIMEDLKLSGSLDAETLYDQLKLVYCVLAG